MKSAPFERSVPRANAAPPWAFAFLLAGVVLVLKAPDALTHAQFWAEDGVIFFLTQHGEAAPQLFVEYAHYLLVIQRLVAWIASAFSAVDAPLIYNAATLLIGAAALASLRSLRSFGPGFMFALLSIALVPTNGEVFGTLTNVQWLVQFYLITFLARLIRGESSRLPVLRFVVAALVGLSGPISCFVAPVAVVTWVWTTRRGEGARPRHSSVGGELIVLVACAAIQAIYIATSGGAGDAGESLQLAAWLPFLASLQIHVFGVRVVPTWLFLVLFGALVAGACRRARADERIFVFAWLAVVGLELLATAWRFFGEVDKFLAFGYGDRYFLLFKVTFWWLFAIALARALPQRRAGSAGLVAGVLLCCNAALMADSLTRKPLADLEWESYARRIDRGEAVDVPINPPPWRIQVPAEK
ncbi:MAG: hypothetical protein ABI843_05200 [Dokdonella sp.]